jgi:hypothetical protein
MSKGQQLLTRYLSDLCPALAIRYRFHFLHIETDSAAKQMVRDDLQRLSSTVGNPRITSALTSTSQISWAFSEESDLSATTTDPLSLARSHFGSLRLESALRLFQKGKHVNPHYFERFQVNLVFGRFPAAFSLAEKMGTVEALFVSSIAVGDFGRASALATDACRSLNRIQNMQGPKEFIVSAWELAHLIIYVTVATGSCPDVRRRIKEVRGATPYAMEALMDTAGLFAGREFRQFGERLRGWKKEFALSYYAAPVAAKLEQEMRMNVVANAVRPFGRIKLARIASMIGCDEETVGGALVVGINNGRVRGYVDRVDGMFYGTTEFVEGRKMEGLLERAVILREKIEVLQWKNELESGRK